jgi:predicted AAA+ superfamily ATPase
MLFSTIFLLRARFKVLAKNILHLGDYITKLQEMYIPRLITHRLEKLLASFPAVVVTGARQVGKSTLVQHLYGDRADIVVFDPAIDVENARQDPDLFLDNHKTPLVLDEIQYAPELVASLKRRIDKDRRPGQYILTGSQQWSVLSSIAESLAGRAVFLDLEGFCLAELARSSAPRPWLAAWLDDPPAFVQAPPPRLSLGQTLHERLWRGGLPQAAFLDLDLLPDFFAAYQRTYLERDVRLLADVSDWQLFGRFLRLAAALTAREINHSQLGRELGITPQTARRWLDMLKATFQWFEVPAYAASTIKRVSRKPKGYIADTGFACHAQAISTPAAIGGHPLRGALFETAMVAEIRKQCATLSPPPMLYHWRTNGGAEVDLILERDGVFYPLEIKSKSNPGRRDTTGLTAFRKTYPSLRIEKGLVIAPAQSVLRISENDCAVPWDLDGK